MQRLNKGQCVQSIAPDIVKKNCKKKSENFYYNVTLRESNALYDISDHAYDVFYLHYGDIANTNQGLTTIV